jgi:RimJ/RimL family protein N-acetyltransferase
VGFLPAQPLDDGIVALRLIDERDIPVLEQASRDPEIATRFGLSTRTAGEYLDGFKEGWSGGIAAAFAVTERGGPALGQVLLEVRGSGRADVGYWLLAEARGRGLATRALRLLSSWALDQPGIARLQLWTSPENTASAGVAERSGFKREGVLRSYAQREDGSRVDAVVFSLLPEECEPGGAQ